MEIDDVSPLMGYTVNAYKAERPKKLGFVRKHSLIQRRQFK